MLGSGVKAYVMNGKSGGAPALGRGFGIVGAIDGILFAQGSVQFNVPRAQTRRFEDSFIRQQFRKEFADFAADCE